MKTISVLFLLFCNVMAVMSASVIKVADNYLRQHDIVYLEPEYDGFNGFPLGNGDLGGMLWFSDEGLEIQFNKIDLYEQTAASGMVMRSAGRFKLNFGVPCFSYMHLSDFEARLSLQDANVQIKGETPFVNIDVTSWVDANSNVWVVDCQSDYKDNLLSGATNIISLERWGSRTFPGWYGSREKNPAKGLGKAQIKEEGNDLILQEEFEGGLRFTVACRILDTSVDCRRISDRKSSFFTQPSPKQKYKILIAVATSNEAADPTSKAILLLDNAEEKTIATVEKGHKDWWANFWSKSFVHLSDNYIENIYYIRRYLMGSSSRGKYPAPFNGSLWTTNYDHHQWVTPHHWNTQESYWGLAAQNDCELLLPYIETYFNMIPQAQALAKKKGARGGLLVTEAHDFSGGMVSANWGNMTTNYTPASQIGKIMWEYYAYTKDRKYLEKTIYPFIKEAAEFYLNFLQWDEEKDEYFIFPAQPYEHEWTSQLKNTITDRYMIESLFKNCITAANDLGVDKSKIKQWEHVLAHLWEPPINEIPGIGKVFGSAFTEAGEPYPLHQKSLVYHFDAPTTAVFPAGVLGLDQKGTPYFDIAKTIALNHPKDRNAITPGAIVSARLGLGNKVLERLQCSINYLQHFTQGLFYNIDHWYCSSRYYGKVPNGELYTQRDYMYDSRSLYNSKSGGNSGFRTRPFVQCGMETLGIIGTAVNEMLLQSHEGKIKVFPAIPDKFSAAFTLRAEGAFMVSSVIDSMNVIPFVEVESLVGGKCRIQNPWGNNEVQVVTTTNRKVPVKIDKKSVISFDTNKGESYLIIKKDDDYQICPRIYLGKQNMYPKKYGEAILGKERTFSD